MYEIELSFYPATLLQYHQELGEGPPIMDIIAEYTVQLQDWMIENVRRFTVMDGENPFDDFSFSGADEDEAFDALMHDPGMPALDVTPSTAITIRIGGLLTLHTTFGEWAVLNEPDIAMLVWRALNAGESYNIILNPSIPFNLFTTFEPMTVVISRK